MKSKLLFLAFIASLCIGLIFLSQCKKDCTQGYTGRKCDEQITPSSITITKVTVKSFCNGCDPDENYPDIYIKILNETDNVLYNGGFYQDVSSGTGNWEWNLNITINPNQQYKMRLYDYDAITDDLLHSCIFSPYSSTGGFPSSKDHSCSPFSFINNLSYSW